LSTVQEALSRARLDFKVKVLAIDRGICVNAAGSPCSGDVQAHHVIYQKHLVRAGLDLLLWDPTNGVAVCEAHHRRHHAGREPIPKYVLPTRCRDFAHEHGLDYLLDRFYA
jgi:hypothetical protein